jgi:hypothetical protein
MGYIAVADDHYTLMPKLGKSLCQIIPDPNGIEATSDATRCADMQGSS